jgi:hypothetical protein
VGAGVGGAACIYGLGDGVVGDRRWGEGVNLAAQETWGVWRVGDGFFGEKRGVVEQAAAERAAEAGEDTSGGVGK